MKEIYAILELGSNNTKTHIYENDKLIFENSDLIEFKKNYSDNNKISEEDLDKLDKVITKAKEYTDNVYVYGCSIFRNISKEELDELNKSLIDRFNVKIEVVSQEEEALYTAKGCYGDIDYKGNICIFIGGGGSTELIFVNNKKIINKKLFNFGVVDITKKFSSLKEDVPLCSFDEVYSYIDSLIGEIDITADLLILAGGDHLYWYNNAEYELLKNTLYKNDNQKYMLTSELNNKYDRDALVSSLDKVRAHSDNPKWFDGSRAMKVTTNQIANKIGAKYIIPTKINMEDGLRQIVEGKN